jgi:hypothetical protein
MKEYYKECKSAKQAHNFLKRLGLEGWSPFTPFEGEFIPEWNTLTEEYQLDCWNNLTETRGADVTVYPDFTVSVTKYTCKDIERIEAELLEPETGRAARVPKYNPCAACGGGPGCEYCLYSAQKRAA